MAKQEVKIEEVKVEPVVEQTIIEEPTQDVNLENVNSTNEDYVVEQLEETVKDTSIKVYENLNQEETEEFDMGFVKSAIKDKITNSMKQMIMYHGRQLVIEKDGGKIVISNEKAKELISE